MLYRIEYLEQTFNQLAKIPKNIRTAIIKAVNERLTTTPERFKPLSCNFKHCFRLRVGEYRVIYKINKQTVTVLIIKIGHRKHVYD